MAQGFQTNIRNYRFLRQSDFAKLYESFIKAYSDYVIPVALSEQQLLSHLRLTGVDLERSIGCMVGDDLVGFSLNAFGDWQRRPSVYDAGTGVIPSCRQQRISHSMFEFMVSTFPSAGIEQFLLEVVSTNTAAIRLYEKFNFCPQRELSLLQCDLRINSEPRSGVEIRALETPDWTLLESYWDTAPTWQNSIAAVHRSHAMKRILGALIDGKVVGYVVFSGKFGRVAQFAVDHRYRRQGIGTDLLLAVQNETAEGFSMQVINQDRSDTAAMSFFRKHGFFERLIQYEMLLSFD